MKGNSHAQFLEGWTGAIPSGYSVQTVPEPDAGLSSATALFGDDLVGRSHLERGSGDAAVSCEKFLAQSLLRSESFVTEMVPKRPRLRLGPHWYKELCRQVLARDNWRCQVCGSSNNLQVHHQQLRSQQGSDEDSNLITLCAECHAQLHGSRSENHRLWE